MNFGDESMHCYCILLLTAFINNTANIRMRCCPMDGGYDCLTVLVNTGEYAAMAVAG